MKLLIQCPFFKSKEALHLCCEGATVKFPDKEARSEYLESYCANPISWKKCSVAHCMENYYERKD